MTAPQSQLEKLKRLMEARAAARLAYQEADDAVHAAFSALLPAPSDDDVWRKDQLIRWKTEGLILSDNEAAELAELQRKNSTP